MDETFAEAIAHRRGAHRVLGLRLLPFAYWHAAGLDLIESPFAAHPGAQDFAALYLAARVCRSVYPRFELAGSALARKLTAFAFARSFALERLRFGTYLRDYRSGPVFATRSDSTPPKCPWYLVDVASLVQGCGMKPSEAWMMPIGEAQWLLTAQAEITARSHGKTIDILTPALREALEKAGQQV